MIKQGLQEGDRSLAPWRHGDLSIYEKSPLATGLVLLLVFGPSYSLDGSSSSVGEDNTGEWVVKGVITVSHS